MSVSCSSPPPPPAPAPDPLDVLDDPEVQALLHAKASKFPTGKKDIERYLEDIPIMTTVIPQLEEEKSADLAAIEAIAREEPVEDRVEAFKQSGNEAYKQAMMMKTMTDIDSNRVNKKLHDAYEYYSHAIALNTFLPLLSSSVYSNRALVSLSLENYGLSLSDCVLAIKKNPNNRKAWYRGALALKKINKLEKAREWCEKGMACMCKHVGKQEQKALQTLNTEIQREQHIQDTREKEIQNRKRQKEKEQQEEIRAIIAALDERELILGKPMFHSNVDAAHNDEQADDDEDHERKSDELPSVSALSSSSLSSVPYQGQIRVLPDSSSSLSFPLLFLYPDELQSDHIERHHELAPLSQTLAMMFPPASESPPWDPQHKYTMDSISVWVEIQISRRKNQPFCQIDDLSGLSSADVVLSEDEDKVRVRVDPELSLLSILTMPALKQRGYQIPGIPTFIVKAGKTWT